MERWRWRFSAIFTAGLFAGTLAAATSPLAARGYTVLPAPQEVILGQHDLAFGPAWRLEAPGVPAGDVAMRTLKEELSQRHNLPAPAGSGAVVLLRIAPGSVQPGKVTDVEPGSIAPQAYRITLARDRIEIRANAGPGLFYGVETLAQLLKRRDGSVWFPEGEITDWPDLEMRTLYWDDAHHLERPAELKRAIRQAAFYKINGFALKLEGHFQFKSAPALVEPYALSPAEYQDLTDYGLRYHVQLIPFLDGPAHIAFILKHPEYAGLRAFPDSNYELCVTNPDSYKLLEGMYQDLLDANKGVKYFYLSTDEAYYVGMAANQGCQEKAEAGKLGSRGKLLAQFLDKAAGYLHQHGRTVLFWGEYPLQAGDIAALPAYLQNGEVYSPAFNRAFTARGMRQNIYTSTQGEERIFPDYYYPPGSRRNTGRVESMFETISSDSTRKEALLKGVFVAGWADAGQHPENFWLGYAAGLSYAWKPAPVPPAEATQAFFYTFYGPRVTNMTRAYQLLSFQAQFWSTSWDQGPSTTSKGIWGASERIFDKRRPRHDQSFPLPAVPGANLAYPSGWKERTGQRVAEAGEFLSRNDELIGLLDENLTRAEHNRYNLRVMRSNALLCRQNLQFLLSLGQVDEALARAAESAAGNQPASAIGALDRALDEVRRMRAQRNRVYHDVVAVWYESWFPRTAEANGRRFLHELDDVKDHVPDRTVDMSYLIQRELDLRLGQWYEKVQAVRNGYAAAHQQPMRSRPLNWGSLDD
ncbi:MAG: beta-N-acetylhexosaminidase [Bryobacterales bacterium]|nr:beta-N-acetylhexosaminidase [Bryobacterales bacterium]